MAFSSVHEMIDLCKESGKPLYEVILESDLAESGLTRAESEAEMHRLWAVMRATSDGYCGADRSMSGFAGGDAAKVNAAAARGVLYADGYFADVMAEALKTAECNACMKRIVAAPTAGSCGVLPAVLLPLQRRGLADEAAVHRALGVVELLRHRHLRPGIPLGQISGIDVEHLGKGVHLIAKFQNGGIVHFRIPLNIPLYGAVPRTFNNIYKITIKTTIRRRSPAPG